MILGRRAYRQHLPHYQQDGRGYFVTFVTHRRWTLPPSARASVLEHVLIEHQWRAYLHTVVVMPDHVHIVLTPLANGAGETYAISEISKGIKGSSARTVNRLLSRTGTISQKESFDYELRRDESVRSKCEYVAQNPIRRLFAERSMSTPGSGANGSKARDVGPTLSRLPTPPGPTESRPYV